MTPISQDGSLVESYLGEWMDAFCCDGQSAAGDWVHTPCPFDVTHTHPTFRSRTPPSCPASPRGRATDTDFSAIARPRMRQLVRIII